MDQQWIVIIVMTSVVVVTLLCKAVKKYFAPAKKSESAPRKEITSQDKLDLLKGAMELVFTEDVANNDHVKVMNLVNDWKLDEKDDYEGYLHQLADLLEECSSLNWQEYHFNIAMLHDAADVKKLSKQAPYEMIVKHLELRLIYRTLGDVLKERDFRE